MESGGNSGNEPNLNKVDDNGMNKWPTYISNFGCEVSNQAYKPFCAAYSSRSLLKNLSGVFKRLFNALPQMKQRLCLGGQRNLLELITEEGKIMGFWKSLFGDGSGDSSQTPQVRNTKATRTANGKTYDLLELQKDAKLYFARFTGTDTSDLQVAKIENVIEVISTLSEIERQIRNEAQTLSSMGLHLDQLVNQLYDLTRTYDSSRESTPEYKAKVREIGSLLGEAGGKHLMQAVGYRMTRKGCSEYSFSLNWDGICGWWS